MEAAADAQRLFFALWPSGELQARMAAWANQAAGRGRAMRRENLHLTLAFLGDIDAVRVPGLITLAAGLRFAAFRLALDRVGYWEHNRIIWCGAGAEPRALADLAAGLRACLDTAGVRYDSKPFVSHVTLVRNAPGLPSEPPWTPLILDAADFALVRSTREEGRVVYRVLRRFPAAPG